MSKPEPAATTRAERRAAERAQRRSGQRRQPTAATPFWRKPAGLVTIAAILGGALLLIGVILVQRPGPGGGSGAAVDLQAPVARMPVALADGMALGPASAPVVMEVWGDFQCPAYGLFATSTLPNLVRDFIEPGTLRVVAHDVAILDRGTTESSDAAAGAACANEQGSYWPYHDWLFANQAGENRGAFRREVLDEIARRVGLDGSIFKGCLDGGKHQAAALAAPAAGSIRQTPTIVVAGQRIEGLPAYEALAAFIRQAAGTTGP